MSTEECLAADLVLELTQLFAASASLGAPAEQATTTAVDPNNLKKCIPALMKVGTLQAMNLKERIIANSTGRAPKPSSNKDLPVSKTLPNGFPYYPSVSAAGSSKLDWGTIHAGNSDWSMQEKIDGSQCTFGVDKITATVSHKDLQEEVISASASASAPESTESSQSFSIEEYNIVLSNGSKSCVNNVAFKCVRAALSMLLATGLLNPNIVYHLEFVSRLRHNVVVYERLPRFFCVAYDMQDCETRRWFEEEEIRVECARIGMESTQVFWCNKTRTGTCKFLVDDTNSVDGYVTDPMAFGNLVLRAIMDGRVKSMLGGQPEGLVIKCRQYVDRRGDTVCKRSKMVTSDFKEVHHKPKPKPPVLSVSGHIQWIGSMFDVPARLRKAFQRLRDSDLPVEEKRAKAKDMDFVHANLDADLEKEVKDEIIGYLVGDFRMRCVRADPADLDLEDELLPIMQAFATDADALVDDALWLTMRPHVFKYARASLPSWFAEPVNAQWVSELFD